MISNAAWLVLSTYRKMKNIIMGTTLLLSKVLLLTLLYISTNFKLIEITGLQDLTVHLFSFVRRGDYDANLVTDRIVNWMTEFGERRFLSSLLSEVNIMELANSQPSLVHFFGLLSKKRPNVFAANIGMLETIIGT